MGKPRRERAGRNASIVAIRPALGQITVQRKSILCPARVSCLPAWLIKAETAGSQPVTLALAAKAPDDTQSASCRNDTTCRPR